LIQGKENTGVALNLRYPGTGVGGREKGFTGKSLGL
jgi:hypothetical protein